MPPGSLQTLTFGYRLGQSLHGDDAVQPAVGELWPQFQPELAWGHAASSLQTITCGYRINRSLNSVMLQNSLRSLTFGFRFYQNFRSVRRH